MCPLQKKNPILLLSLSVVVSKKKKNKKKNEIARADVKTFFFPLFLAGGAISLSLSVSFFLFSGDESVRSLGSTLLPFSSKMGCLGFHIFLCNFWPRKKKKRRKKHRKRVRKRAFTEGERESAHRKKRARANAQRERERERRRERFFSRAREREKEEEVSLLL
jgi:hypothetical protein